MYFIIYSTKKNAALDNGHVLFPFDMWKKKKQNLKNKHLISLYSRWL